MTATATSPIADQFRTVVRGVSRAREGRARWAYGRPERIATLAREAHKTAPRTGGVSSTERKMPGCVTARSCDRRFHRRRDTSEGLDWLQ